MESHEAILSLNIIRPVEYKTSTSSYGKGVLNRRNVIHISRIVLRTWSTFTKGLSFEGCNKKAEVLAINGNI